MKKKPIFHVGRDAPCVFLNPKIHVASVPAIWTQSIMKYVLFLVFVKNLPLLYLKASQDFLQLWQVVMLKNNYRECYNYLCFSYLSSSNMRRPVYNKTGLNSNKSVISLNM